VPADALDLAPSHRLYDVFRDALPEHDPTLADALTEYPEAGQLLSWQQAEAEALWWVWVSDLAIDEEPCRSYLARLPGAHSGVPYARLDLERRLRRVIAKVAGEPGARPYRVSAIPGDGTQRVDIDPELLLTMMGSERQRDAIIRPQLHITHLRLHATSLHSEAKVEPPTPWPDHRTRDEVLIAMREAGARPPWTQSWSRTAEQARAARGLLDPDRGYSDDAIRARWHKLELG
jgi:hypothetical protein